MFFKPPSDKITIEVSSIKIRNVDIPKLTNMKNTQNKDNSDPSTGRGVVIPPPSPIIIPPPNPKDFQPLTEGIDPKKK